MAEITIAQKHTIKAKADPFTLTVEIDLDRVSDVTLEFHRAGTPKSDGKFTLIEADIATLEELCAGARTEIQRLTRRVRGELGIEQASERSVLGKAVTESARRNIP